MGEGALLASSMQITNFLSQCDILAEKNFFAKTLHPYISRRSKLLMHKNLQRFQILPNPTLTLH